MLSRARREQSTERASVGRGRRHPSSRALAAGYICLHVTDLRRVSAIHELRLVPVAMDAFFLRISSYLIILRQTKVCLTSRLWNDINAHISRAGDFRRDMLLVTVK